jgi:hypothetical protein
MTGLATIDRVDCDRVDRVDCDWVLLESGDAPPAGKTRVAEKVDVKGQLADEDESVVLCRACDQLITDLRQRIRVQDAHEHRFMNPGGFLFHIGCFAQAIGCRVIGPDSWEYPWFAGFAWRCAHCGGCGRQLGWNFRSDTPGLSSFFGLVLDRLRIGTSSAARG